MRRKPETLAQPAFGTENGVVDYILGITFDIWEKARVEDIFHYYADDVVVFGLDQLVSGAATMVDQTHSTLKAFPDRLLLGDDIIWSGSTFSGYSSHRVVSPMTNLGETDFGPATGRRIQIMNIADCEITDGVITQEWLARDNLALVRQLGFDPDVAAREMSNRFTPATLQWHESEISRVLNHAGKSNDGAKDSQPETLARAILETCWMSGDSQKLQSLYAPYCVLHRAPVRIVSGEDSIAQHYAGLRDAFPSCRVAVDHVCSQPFNDNGIHLAARWSVAGGHQGEYRGLKPGGAPVCIMGISHWRILDGRIISEWTVFDELAIAAQIINHQG